MILQVLAKAGEFGCDWAKHVPKNALSSGGNNSSGNNGTRKVILICDTSEEAGASTMEFCSIQ